MTLLFLLFLPIFTARLKVKIVAYETVYFSTPIYQHENVSTNACLFKIWMMAALTDLFRFVTSGVIKFEG